MRLARVRAVGCHPHHSPLLVAAERQNEQNSELEQSRQPSHSMQTICVCAFVLFDFVCCSVTVHSENTV